MQLVWNNFIGLEKKCNLPLHPPNCCQFIHGCNIFDNIRCEVLLSRKEWKQGPSLNLILLECIAENTLTGIMASLTQQLMVLRALSPWKIPTTSGPNHLWLLTPRKVRHPQWYMFVHQNITMILITIACHLRRWNIIILSRLFNS